MRIALGVLLSAVLWASSRDLQRRADEKRIAEYHRLNARHKKASMEMQNFLESFGRDCLARGQELKLDPTGDPVCQNKPPVPSSVEAKPAPPSAPK